MIDRELWGRIVWKSQLPYTYGTAWALGSIASVVLAPLVYLALKYYVLMWIGILGYIGIL